jgi:hypothetical protein
MSEEEGRFTRWSRRKLEASAAEQEDMAPSVEPAEEAPDAEAEELAGLPDAEVLERLGLKDPDEMMPGDDFAGFMKRAVPEHLRRRALRRLWRSNPVLANLDGLNDYDTDFTGDSVAPGMLKTAYKVGIGLMREAPETAKKIGDATAAGEAPADDRAGDSPADDPETRADAEENDIEKQILQDSDDARRRPRRRMRFDFEA